MNRMMASTSQSLDLKHHNLINFWLTTSKWCIFRIDILFDKLKWTKFSTFNVPINILLNKAYGGYHISKFKIRESRLNYLLA